MAKVGRPTRYRPYITEKTRAYLKECQDEEIEEIKSQNESTGNKAFNRRTKVNLPSIEGLAVYLKANKTQIYDWALEFPEFGNAIQDLKNEQGKRLISKSLSGDYNPVIAKLLLSSSHGYREQTGVDITSNGQSIVKINYITPEEKTLRDVIDIPKAII